MTPVQIKEANRLLERHRALVDERNAFGPDYVRSLHSQYKTAARSHVCFLDDVDMDLITGALIVRVENQLAALGVKGFK